MFPRQAAALDVFGTRVLFYIKAQLPILWTIMAMAWFAVFVFCIAFVIRPSAMLALGLLVETGAILKYVLYEARRTYKLVKSGYVLVPVFRAAVCQNIRMKFCR
jgi:hypothetical protein